MKERLGRRLTELKAEYESGQKMLTNLEQRRGELSNTLLRISGAILVLEEELEKEADELARAKEVLSSGEPGLQGLQPLPDRPGSEE